MTWRQVWGWSLALFFLSFLQLLPLGSWRVWRPDLIWLWAVVWFAVKGLNCGVLAFLCLFLLTLLQDTLFATSLGFHAIALFPVLLAWVFIHRYFFMCSPWMKINICVLLYSLSLLIKCAIVVWVIGVPFDGGYFKSIGVIPVLGLSLFFYSNRMKANQLFV